MVATDLLCLAAALLGSYLLTGHQLPTLFAQLVRAAAAAAAWVTIFAVFGLYHVSNFEEPRGSLRILGATSVGVLVMAAGLWRVPAEVSLWLAPTYVIALVLELAARYGWRAFLIRQRSTGRGSLRTLVVGTNEEADHLAARLKAAGSGFAPLGYVTSSMPSISPNGIPVLGPLERLEGIIRDRGADCLFVASTALGVGEMMTVTQAARRTGVEVRVSTPLSSVLPSRVMVGFVGNDLSLSLRPRGLTRTQRVLKRILDLTLASTALLISLPPWLIIAAAIKLTSPGPVLFRQERVTRGMRVFTLYKFRTMGPVPDVPPGTQTTELTAPFFKLRDDPRLTKVGRFLRSTSLDELPQLLNVIRGDMSLVGPRPLWVKQVAANPELLTARHEMLAGITGWWQIRGRSDIGPEEAVQLDQFYIENWNLGLDLHILTRTVGVVLGRRGAY